MSRRTLATFLRGTAGSRYLRTRERWTDLGELSKKRKEVARSSSQPRKEKRKRDKTRENRGKISPKSTQRASSAVGLLLHKGEMDQAKLRSISDCGSEVLSHSGDEGGIGVNRR